MSTIVYRPYQVEAIEAGVNFLKSTGDQNAIEILPTGAGKSVVIAGIIRRLGENTLILQPSKEILVQNFNKYRAYGFYASVYSASAGRKEISSTVFATIGSIVKKPALFRNFKYILIDECHLVNSNGGMYDQLIKELHWCRVLGFTATPYRLTSDGFGGSQLKFLTRTCPAIFRKVIYYVQNKTLFDQGYLSKVTYYQYGKFDRSKIRLNSTGADFDEQSLKHYYKQINLPDILLKCLLRLMEIRKNVLVFVRYIKEAEALAAKVPGSTIVTGEMDKTTRDKVLNDFKSGKTKVLINIGVVSIGFDFPELETILLGRETLSLALYYQMIGRGIRIHPSKESCWVVDCCGNYKLFGKVEDLHINEGTHGKWFISSNGIPLTNVYFSKEDNIIDPVVFDHERKANTA